MDNLICINDKELNSLNLKKTEYKIKGVVPDKVLTRNGKITENRIWIDGVEVIPEIGFSLRPYYGSSFDWGWDSGNPGYNTSLSACCYIFRDERIAENLFIPFKEEFIDMFPSGNFEMDLKLEDFLTSNNDRLHPHLYSCFCKTALVNSREILVYKDPETGKISANLADNYAMHDKKLTNLEVKKLNERKQRLVFRLFAKDDYLITGYDFKTVMDKSEEVMDRFYKTSFERIMKKRY